MIVSGGITVCPREAEEVLIAHAAVNEVEVIGVPNDDLGTVLKALVKPAEASAADPLLALELLDFCAARLSRIKCPKSIEFVGEAVKRLPAD